MAKFPFIRKDHYPGLDISVGFRIGTVEKVNYLAFASMTARGPMALREKWRRDVMLWAETRGVESIRPLYGAARIDGTSCFELILRGWTIAADFLLVWVGEQAFRDVSDPLEFRLQRLTDAVRRLEAIASRQEARVRDVSAFVLDTMRSASP